jgi:Fic family protein
VNNYIQGIDKNGKNFVRFKPLDFYQTPTAMQDLCKNYLHEINNSISDPLILTFIFILDFLCIHPFNDGNGRMSRLLTSLLLYKHNFSVGKYISLEKLIDENKEGYYTSLQKSSNN